MTQFLPTTRCIHQDQQQLLGTAHIGRELLAFAGHFPDCAIFPGVAQIAMVQNLVAEHFANLGVLHKIEQLRFQQFILPDQNVAIEVERQAQGFRFKVLNDTQDIVASGRLVFKV